MIPHTLTEVQKQALEEARKVLGEHFDSYLIVTSLQGRNDDMDFYTYRTNGTFAESLGLAAYVQHRMLHP